MILLLVILVIVCCIAWTLAINYKNKVGDYFVALAVFFTTILAVVVANLLMIATAGF